MSKILVIGVIILILGGGLGLFAFKLRNSGSTTSVITNNDLTDIQVPVIQKTLFAATTPSLTSPYIITQGNNPAQSVVGVSGGSITMRISGLNGATNGYELTFTGF